MIHRVTAAEAMAAAGDAVLLDVREQWEYEIVHLSGAILIPLSSVPFRFTELPKDKHLIVYCHTGVRSYQACAFLESQGWNDVTNVEGGIDACAAIDKSLDTY